MQFVVELNIDLDFSRGLRLSEKESGDRSSSLDFSPIFQNPYVRGGINLAACTDNRAQPCNLSCRVITPWASLMVLKRRISITVQARERRGLPPARIGSTDRVDKSSNNLTRLISRF